MQNIIPTNAVPPDKFKALLQDFTKQFMKKTHQLELLHLVVLLISIALVLELQVWV